MCFSSSVIFIKLILVYSLFKDYVLLMYFNYEQVLVIVQKSNERLMKVLDFEFKKLKDNVEDKVLSIVEDLIVLCFGI